MQIWVNACTYSGTSVKTLVLEKIECLVVIVVEYIIVCKHYIPAVLHRGTNIHVCHVPCMFYSTPGHRHTIHKLDSCTCRKRFTCHMEPPLPPTNSLLIPWSIVTLVRPLSNKNVQSRIPEPSSYNCNEEFLCTITCAAYDWDIHEYYISDNKTLHISCIVTW